MTQLPIAPWDPKVLHGITLLDEDVSDLDAVLLDEKGRLKAVPSSVYAAIPENRKCLWAHKHAVYGLPTTELVAFVQEIIGGRTALEIGTGAGCLGRELGIWLTDNHCQGLPEVKLLLAIQEQPAIVYPEDVENIGAIQAVNKYKPQVVVASWVTQLHDGDNIGCMYGVKEEHVIDKVETYIFFGSGRNHSSKRIMKKKHDTYRQPWMYSRANDSVLYVWNRHR